MNDSTKRHATLAAVALVAALAGACGSGPGHRVPPSADEPARRADDDRTVYLGLIERMQREGAYYASLAHIDAFRQRHGDPPRLRLMQADALRGTGQADAARQIYETLTGGAYAAAAWHGLGLIAVAGGQPARAEQALARATELAPLNADYLGDLGYQRLRAGRLADARTPLAMAAELSPANPRAIANLALWSLLQGDTRRAETLMQGAKLPDASRQAVYRLASELRPAVRHAQRADASTGGASPPPLAASAAGIAAPPPMLERFRPSPSAGDGLLDER
ncbi:Flp pilus assembly protein TadD [Pseudoxanthomonas broegbernensis]|uniref:Flp pilus assembly protein TadD n=1 Tax=Pseudoxanthomonas broegbernensis TaxID=83619 RepID=A0A7V8K6L9_9GAMM|nr:Flp pilus assembly protein TadD [Pseudoxanthomonas broegbernensis]KAF1685445.1 Flp pilus assembly protein TadD [Pseudoxanthomonas broegbernensis]MBB6064424.1 Flp pilus assembly protein TadD [Pseudoxanthomonas broegbernensis]